MISASLARAGVGTLLVTGTAVGIAMVAAANPVLAMSAGGFALLVWVLVRDARGRTASVAVGLLVAGPGFETIVDAIHPSAAHAVVPALTLTLCAAAGVSVVRVGVPHSRRPMLLALALVAVLFVAWSNGHPYRFHDVDKGSVTLMYVLLPAGTILLLDRVEATAIRAALVLAAAPIATYALLGHHVPLGALGNAAGRFATENSVWYGRAIALGAVACLGAAGSRLTVPKAVLVAVLVGALVAADKQGPLLGVTCGAVVWWVARRPGLPRILMATATVIVAAMCLHVAFPSMTPAYFYAQLDSDGNATVRRALFVDAWHEFVHAPFVGVGYGSYGGLDRGTPAEYPHDAALELLAETGVVGFLAVVGLAFAGLRRASPDLTPLVSCAIVFALVSGGIPENVEWPLLLAGAVVAASAARVSRVPRPARAKVVQ